MLIHVSTSLEECQIRDTKGLYQKAKDGLIKGLTGVDDPYEIPKNANLIIDTEKRKVSDCVDEIMEYLIKDSLIK